MKRFVRNLVAVALVVMAVLSGAVTVYAKDAAQGLESDGMGWGGIRLGMSYDEAKKVLQGRGFTIRTDLGMYKREDYEYSSTFGAESKRVSGLKYQVYGDTWQRKVYGVTVEMDGVDDKALLERLKELFGEPSDRPGEYNFAWVADEKEISAFLMTGTAILKLNDSRVTEKMQKQALIDQGLAPGEVSPPTPEVEYFNRMQKAFAEALPPIPEGWEMTEESKMGITVPILSKFMERPMPIEYNRSAVNRAPEEELERKHGEVIEGRKPGLESAQAAMEKKIETARPQMEAMGAKIQAAAEKGNMPEVERLTKELEVFQAKLTAEAEKIEPTGDQTLEMVIPSTLDSRCAITVESLDLYATGAKECAEKASWRKDAPVGGNVPVFAQELPKHGDNFIKVHLLAFVGPVGCKVEGRTCTVSRPDLKAVPRMGIACLCVHIAAGTRERARRTLEQIDWKKLRGLVTPAKG